MTDQAEQGAAAGGVSLVHGGSQVFEVDVLDGAEARRQQRTHHQDEERGQELMIKDKNILRVSKIFAPVLAPGAPRSASPPSWGCRSPSARTGAASPGRLEQGCNISSPFIFIEPW